jgi:hypothetical protein
MQPSFSREKNSDFQEATGIRIPGGYFLVTNPCFQNLSCVSKFNLPGICQFIPVMGFG